MKVINAFWEQRNLGLKVCEIIFDVKDNPDIASIAELEREYEYLVAKIPATAVELVHVLENNGFRYLENQIVLQFSSDQYKKLDDSWKSRFKDITCNKVTEEGTLIYISNQIRKGLYVNGRISSDPLIPEGVSDLRIINWLNDLFIKKNASIYILSEQNIPVGYFVLEKIKNVHLNIVQAGIFRDYQNRGFSFLLLYHILRKACEDGFKGIFASISSGNRKTINSISKFVHIRIKESYIVLRKKVIAKPVSGSIHK